MRNRDSEGYMVGSRGGRTRGVCLADYWKGIKKVQGVVAPVNVPSRKLKKKIPRGDAVSSIGVFAQ